MTGDIGQRTPGPGSCRPPEVLLERIVGCSPAIRSIKRLALTVARNDSTVLILGDSGVGKELLARTIHDLSARRDQPFIAANCGALPETLLESQLFGHVRGAFTGATQDTLGIFRAGDGGTVFLDEIGEMSPALQVKLLRTLQEREVTPVGSTHPHPIDVRIIAATNRMIDPTNPAPVLREDLYYRLSVVQIVLPPLRQRPADIPLLLEHFIHRHAVAYGRQPVRIEPQALDVLIRYPWPGNVRELSNFIERHYATGGGPTIDLADIPERMLHAATQQVRPAWMPDKPDSPRPPTGALPTLEEAERELIRRALLLAGGRKTRAAEILNIERHRLTRKIRKYGLDG